jgi:hypothetical protein
MSSLAFRNLLEAGDGEALRVAWAQVAPHLPQPTSREQAETMMHHARTQAESVAFAKRAYSHRWLTERGLPSGLPDHLKPSAERLYPRVVDAVGISCSSRNPHLAPAVALIRGAMETVVQECYADGDTDPLIVKPRMMAARQAESKRLFGAIR